MSVIEFFSQPFWHRLGMALTHFVWQGLGVALLASAVVRLFRLRAGNARYCAYLLAFMVVAICPVITFTMTKESAVPPVKTLMSGAEPRADSRAFSPFIQPFREAPSEREIFVGRQSPPEAALNFVPLQQRVYNALESLLPWAIASWIIGVVLLSGRLLLGFVGVCRWRRNLKPLPENLAHRVAWLGERLGMRGFSAVFISPSALQAMAVGYLRPLVLLPVSMVTRMQPEMLEAVIAHELAHIRRFDLWVNLAQRVIETLLFYHPAVWWLSGQLRSEREFCCDELAIAATGERLTYASALENASRARFEAEESALSLAFGQRRNSTLGRVRHVLGLPPAQPDSRFWLAGVIAVVVLIVLAMPITSALTAHAEEKAGVKSLHEAAAAGDIARVRSLISKGADVNAKDNEGRTPLFYAAENGQSLVCDLLIGRGADLNVKDAVGDTPLHCAARVSNDDFRIATELARRGANVNAINNQGQTPLHVALCSHKGLGKIALRLLQYGTNVNAKDSKGRAALHLATPMSVQGDGSGRLLTTLFAKGADVNLTDANGQTALHMACEYNTNRQDIIKTILRRAPGVNVNAVDKDGVTPLHIAARRDQIDVCEILLNNGASVNAKDEHGHTPAYHALRAGNIETADSLINRGTDMSPIYLAAYQGNLSDLKTLLTTGASVGEEDETGFTVLHAAAAGGRKDIVQYLISQGAEAEAEGGPGWTALGYAVRGNHKEVVELLRAKRVGAGKEMSRLLPAVIERGYREMATLLISLGADIDFNNGEPLTTAVRSGHKEIVDLLISKGADVNAGESRQVPLYTAAHLGRIDIAQRLIDAGANIDALDSRNQRWPLEAAVDARDRKMIEFLLSKGADINRGSEWPPLHHAIHIASTGITTLLIKHDADIDKGESWSALGLAAWYVPSLVELLIDSGGNVNAIAPKSGWAPLHWSAYGNNLDALDLLVSRGADINARTSKGETVLHLLVQWGREPNQVKFVLSRGVDINAADGCGWTALHRAVLYNRPEIIELLIAEGADVNLKDSDGRTALFLSKERGQTEIAELLEKHGAKD